MVVSLNSKRWKNLFDKLTKIRTKATNYQFFLTMKTVVCEMFSMFSLAFVSFALLFPNRLIEKLACFTTCQSRFHVVDDSFCLKDFLIDGICLKLSIRFTLNWKVCLIYDAKLRRMKCQTMWGGHHWRRMNKRKKIAREKMPRLALCLYIRLTSHCGVWSTVKRWGWKCSSRSRSAVCGSMNLVGLASPPLSFVFVG